MTWVTMTKATQDWATAALEPQLRLHKVAAAANVPMQMRQCNYADANMPMQI